MATREPVVIDHHPTVLTAKQQKMWDSGPTGKRAVRKEIREQLEAVLIPEDEYEFMPDFDEEFGGE